MKNEKSIGECYWCGKKATGYDHVPPKTLFYKADNFTPIKNPSCKSHNEDFSQIDYRTSIYIAAVSNSKTANDLITQKIGKSLNHHKSKGLRNTLQRESIADKKGEIFGLIPDADILDKYFEKIIKGLYYFHTKEISHNRKTRNFSRKFIEYGFDYDLSDFMINGFKKNVKLKEGKKIYPEIFKYQYAEYKGFFWAFMTFYGDIEVSCVMVPKYFRLKSFLRNLKRFTLQNIK